MQEFFEALESGDSLTIDRLVSETPFLAVTPGGPNNWEPLLYVCFSPSANRQGLAETARILLRHGANPNAFYPYADGSPLSCLYGAAGQNNNPALAQILLKAGANPNDGESLYHSTEHADLACVRLLLKFGADPNRANALKHMLDREDPAGVALLLAAGADPNERNPAGYTALHWAVWHGRSGAIVTALLDAGATIDAPMPDGRTAYVIAVQTFQTPIAELLQARGASTDTSSLDQPFPNLLPELVMYNHAAAARAVLAAGADVNARGDHGATALHWACWKGYADLVELLLAYGASLTVTDAQYHATPAGWLDHGSRNYCQGGDHQTAARLMAAAAAK